MFIWWLFVHEKPLKTVYICTLKNWKHTFFMGNFLVKLLAKNSFEAQNFLRVSFIRETVMKVSIWILYFHFFALTHFRGKSLVARFSRKCLWRDFWIFSKCFQMYKVQGCVWLDYTYLQNKKHLVGGRYKGWISWPPLSVHSSVKYILCLCFELSIHGPTRLNFLVYSGLIKHLVIASSFAFHAKGVLYCGTTK